MRKIFMKEIEIIINLRSSSNSCQTCQPYTPRNIVNFLSNVPAEIALLIGQKFPLYKGNDEPVDLY